MHQKHNSTNHSSNTRHVNPFLFLNISLYIISIICFMIYTTELHYAHAEGDEDLGSASTSMNASVTVGTACNFSSRLDSPHTSTVSNGINSTDIGTTTLNVTCNDTGGYAIYAIGYTNDEYSNTSLKSNISDDYNISTGTSTSGSTSNWSMKLNTVSGTTTAQIENNYDNYNTVPDDYTKVATLNTITDPNSSTTGSSVSTTYQTYISPTQPAGTYTGKVKYTLVHPGSAAKPEIPPVDMRDAATIKRKLTNVNDTMRVIDARDNKMYAIAKLADGKIWMTENLDLAGGTTITGNDSDIPEGYVLPVANGFQTGNRLPESSQTGFNSYRDASVYNSNNISADCSEPGCYSYYSWTAATAGSGLDIATDNTDAPYSICPKGWKLPTSRTTSSENWKANSDFYQLVLVYGNIYPSFLGEDTSNFYQQAGPGTVPNFSLAGDYYSMCQNFCNGNSTGYYWSSTSKNAENSYFLFLKTTEIRSAINYYKGLGASVRCILR